MGGDARSTRVERLERYGTSVIRGRLDGKRCLKNGKSPHETRAHGQGPWCLRPQGHSSRGPPDEVQFSLRTSVRSVAGAGVGERAEIASRSSAVIPTSSAARESSSCSRFRAPVIGAVTAGCDIARATASIAGLMLGFPCEYSIDRRLSDRSRRRTGLHSGHCRPACRFRDACRRHICRSAVALGVGCT